MVIYQRITFKPIFAIYMSTFFISNEAFRPERPNKLCKNKQQWLDNFCSFRIIIIKQIHICSVAAGSYENT